MHLHCRRGSTEGSSQPKKEKSVVESVGEGAAKNFRALRALFLLPLPKMIIWIRACFTEQQEDFMHVSGTFILVTRNKENSIV